jgi:hypothetical protein
MLPTVQSVEGFDRDDRALNARFRDDDGMALALVFPAHPRADGWLAPELRREVRHEYTSKFDGDNLAYATREDTPLAWDDAARLLERLAPLADASIPGASDVLPEMRHAAACRGGTLPPHESRPPDPRRLP